MHRKRKGIVALHLEGKTNVQIRRALPTMNLTRDLICSAIKRFIETGCIQKRCGGGRLRTFTDRQNGDKVRRRLARNPRCSPNELTKNLNVRATSQVDNEKN